MTGPEELQTMKATYLFITLIMNLCIRGNGLSIISLEFFKKYVPTLKLPSPSTITLLIILHNFRKDDTRNLFKNTYPFLS